MAVQQLSKKGTKYEIIKHPYPIQFGDKGLDCRTYSTGNRRRIPPPTHWP